MRGMAYVCLVMLHQCRRGEIVGQSARRSHMTRVVSQHRDYSVAGVTGLHFIALSIEDMTD